MRTGGSISSYRVGIDIGGTFTDLIAIDEESGKIESVKIPSTPKDFSLGFAQSLERLLKQCGCPPKSLKFLIHASTVATNSVTQHQLPVVGLLTTKGFRDVLEIGRQNRAKLYDLFLDRIEPLVPRHLRREVRERLNYKGEVIVPLNVKQAKDVIRQLKAMGVKSVAVSLLFSFANPVHEHRIKALLEDLCPEVPVSLSSQVLAEFREYERTSTTVVNACLQPIMSVYLKHIEERLKGMDVEAKLRVMRSDGGIMNLENAKANPVYTIESGPAAGVIAASFFGKRLGFDQIISFDMGGTTVKAGLVRRGEPEVTREFEVGGSLHRGKIIKGSGYPVAISFINIAEAGAGGGSIAYVDAGMVLKVGPQSTGAEPGPACYRKGGTEPTITDANVVLGRLNPDYFLGGEMKLDRALAEKAIRDKIGEPLGMSLTQAASGIIKVGNFNMASCIKVVTVEKGYDPKEAVLIAFGGAGPAHAAHLAWELGIPKVVIPPYAGVTSALGLLASNVKHEFVKTHLQRTDRVDLASLNQIYEELEGKGFSAMKEDGIPDDRMVLARTVDMRYKGQAFEIEVEVPGGEIDQIALEKIVEKFHLHHQRLHGFFMKDGATEVVNLRVLALGLIEAPKISELRETAADKRSLGDAQKGVRKVFFDEAGGFVECPIYERDRILPGILIQGPAVLEEPFSTTIVLPGQVAEVDRLQNIIIQRSEEP